MKTSIQSKEEQALVLLQAYHQGDDTAFSHLYNMYVNMMLDYGRCLTRDTELIKDCIQDVFVRLLNRKSPPQVNKIGSYLIVSLRNRLVDEFRKHSFSTDTPADELLEKRVTEGVESGYIAAEQERNIKKRAQNMLDKLTPRQREAFQMYYIEERKYNEICEAMQMNYHSVRNLVHRGMLRLRSTSNVSDRKS